MHLSDEEKAYVQQKKVLQVAAVDGWNPIVSLDDTHAAYQGLAVDILHFLEAETGLQIELVKADSYLKALQLVEEGSADVAAMAMNYQKPGPTGPLDVTEPYLEADIMMIHNKAVDLGNQSSLTIAQVEGEHAISTRTTISYLKFSTLDECLLAVRTGQADAMYCNMFTGLDYVQRFENRELTVIPLYLGVEYRFGLHPGESPVLKQLLNHSIASLNRMDINASLTYGRVGVNNVLDFVYRYPFEIISTVLAVAFLVCLITILYMRTKSHRAISLHGHEASYRFLADTVEGIGLSYNCMEDTLAIFGQHADQLSLPSEIKECSMYLSTPDKGISLTAEQLEQLLVKGMMGETHSTELECRMANGEWQHFFLTFSVLSTNEAYQRPVSLIGYLTNTEHEYQEKENLLHLSRYDKLTGLYNRAGAEVEIQKHLQNQNGTRHDILMLIDVDHFKTFNDTYGHDCGDSVLASLSGHLQRIFRKGDIICRWGGDEILLYLIGAANNIERIQDRCRLLQAAMKEYQYKGENLPVTLSIGGVVMSEYTLDDAFKLADQALYAAKKHGRDYFHIISE